LSFEKREIVDNQNLIIHVTGGKTRALGEQLRTNFDLIVVDTAPMGPVVDATVAETLGLGASLVSRDDAAPAVSTGTAERTPAPPASATDDVRQDAAPSNELTTY
jgi:hypothetical protein